MFDRGLVLRQREHFAHELSQVEFGDHFRRQFERVAVPMPMFSSVTVRAHQFGLTMPKLGQIHVDLVRHAQQHNSTARSGTCNGVSE